MPLEFCKLARTATLAWFKRDLLKIFAVVVPHRTLSLTVALGVHIVRVMKGPA